MTYNLERHRAFFPKGLRFGENLNQSKSGTKPQNQTKLCFTKWQKLRHD